MTEKSPNKFKVLKRWLGLGLVALSFALYGSLLLVPFTPFSAGNKLMLSSLLVIGGEASFWIAVLIMGKQIITKYRKLDIRRWLGNRKESEDEEWKNG